MRRFPLGDDMGKVFISYSHDTAQHSERVLQLANALRNHGVDAELDRYQVRPPNGWPHWCEEQLRPEISDFVLMICTDIYHRRVRDAMPADEGLGVFFEGSIILNYIYAKKGNERFIPVLLDNATKDSIPIVIREQTRYHINTFELSDAEFKGLVDELSRRPPVPKPPLYQMLPRDAQPSKALASSMPPRRVQTTFPSIAASRLFRTSSSSDSLVGREDELRGLDAAWSGVGKKNVVTIVAWGGVGKTSLVARWAADTLAKENHGGIQRYFDWSFYSQGTSGDGDTGADSASADVFVKEALEFFGEPALAQSNARAWQKGERLARLVAEPGTLLILDGLEPLQNAKNGTLRDEAVRALLRGLAADNQGLCLVTTRQGLPELNTWHATTAPERQLAQLSKGAGAELLRKLGVNGTTSEREQLASDVKGHALTLTLLGKYLVEAHGGDIRKRDLISLTEADYEETSGHAYRVVEAYERWLERDGLPVELAILRLLGLFEGPATPDCLAALRQAPAIPGLTDSLAPLPAARWNLAVARLVQMGLVEKQPWERHRLVGYSEDEASKAKDPGYQLSNPCSLDSPGSGLDGPSLDAHPLIREYFGRRIREIAPEAGRAAHSRLFEYLRRSAPHWPEGLDGLQPLYQAIVHGCLAGRYQEACDEVYRERILRGTSFPNAFYSSRKLGALGADLAAMRCFFIVPWTQPVPELDDASRAWLLNEASLKLLALCRLSDARESMQVSMDTDVGKEDWKGAAISASILSELDLAVGDIASAVHRAEQSVTFADWSGDDRRRMTKRGRLAYALHKAGRAKEARARLEEAEALRRAKHLDSLSYGLQSFQAFDLLMADLERAAWRAVLECADPTQFMARDSQRQSCVDEMHLERDGVSRFFEVLRDIEQRTVSALAWVTEKGWLLPIAFNELTLGRSKLYRALLEPSAFDIRSSELLAHIEAAVHGLREANVQHHLISALLTRAWLRKALRQTAEALADLAEAQQISELGPMPLFLADVHLHRARLFFRDYLDTARAEMTMARLLIEKHGYLCRIEELQDAEKAISRGPSPQKTR